MSTRVVASFTTYLSALLVLACQGDLVGESSPDSGSGGGTAGAGGSGPGGAGASGSAGAGGSTTGGGGVPSGGGGTTGGGGTSGSGASGGASGSGATGSGGATTTGPGPYGALPAGYCCTSDAECRFRRCTQFGSVKMCSDECSSTSGCVTGQNMICNTGSGYCEPSGTPTCIPQNQYPLGTKKTGECCIATGDGHSGEECEGGRCVSVGDISNPFICTQACGAGPSCPVKFYCLGGMFCAPSATTYSCN